MDLRWWWLLLFLVGCSSGGTSGGTTSVGQPNDVVTADHGALFANGKALTPQFRAIDSFDVSRDRREVVFSAKRDTNFDIGLVSLDGSDVHWLPEDPADEVAVQWAPRGNKVSYIIRGAGGDLVRTVHIPTAMQVVADFPYARVRSFTWDLSGERYTVTVSSPDASDRVVSMKYDGTAQKTIREPATKLDVNLQSFAGGVIMWPSLLKYNERVPLVMWQSENPLEWNETRGALMKAHRIAIAVVKSLPAAAPDEAWIDPARVLRVTPDVESSAPGWIAQQLKEPNGSR